VDNKIVRLRIAAMPFALLLSACQTMDEAPVVNTWNSMPPSRLSDSVSRPERLNGAPLLANTRGGKSTIVEGTGRFVGDPPIESIRWSGDTGDAAITINLVNVPAPQAAKTILGDILSVRYTIDPGIEGKITIQTPKPVAKAA
jgi:general secretion pathway protein D